MGKVHTLAADTAKESAAKKAESVSEDETKQKRGSVGLSRGQKDELELSEDAQALRKLKSQMALEVGHAKTLFARNPKSRKGNAAARKAAALAKQVITKVHTLAADKAKENAAKKAESVSEDATKQKRGSFGLSEAEED